MRNGKVLVYLADLCGCDPNANKWLVFDPDVPTLGLFIGSWATPDNADPDAYPQANSYDNYTVSSGVEISGTRSECGDNCGKVLVTSGCRAGTSYVDPDIGFCDTNKGRFAQLYDPEYNRFERVGVADDVPGFSQLTALHDGRVLVVSISHALSNNVGGIPTAHAKLLETAPVIKFSPAATPPSASINASSPSAVLPDNTVLSNLHYYGEASGHGDKSPGYGNMATYSPRDDKWAPADPCGSDVSYCAIVTSLVDGTVMAAGNNIFGSYEGENRVFLFHPVRRTWRETGSVNNVWVTAGVVRLSGSGCANCGKVLAVGPQPYFLAPRQAAAELYTPPACTATTTGC